ncbi:MAG: SDR family NAD(P)-dependent oxidoreductase, partial [Proteobacteria bacterium]
MKFVITGATGHLGKLVVSRLLEQVPNSDVGVSVRDPEKAAALLEKGVRVRHGDFAAPESLLGAFDQAEKLLIVSPNVVGEKAIHQHRAAIDAAKKVGVKHLFYTSHMGASSTSAFPPMISHAAAESYLQASGVPFTALRNGFYAESMMMYLQEALQTGELNLPEDGPVAWTT